MSHADSAENAETMRGPLYVMEKFAERAHSACAPRPDGKAQAKRVRSAYSLNIGIMLRKVSAKVCVVCVRK